LTLSVTYLFLSSGIQFKNIDFDSLRINKLYIKWDEKLNIHIKELHIYKNNKPSSKNYSIDELITYFNKTIYLPLFIDSFHIDSLKINDINGSIAYTEGGNGFIDLHSKSFELHATITTGTRYLNLFVDQFKSLDKKLSADAKLVLDTLKSTLYLNSTIDVGNDVSLNINAFSNTKRLDYAISSNKSIPSTSYLVSILEMDPRVVYWIDDAIKMKGLQLQQAYGFIQYNKLDEALNNFYAYAVADKLEYTYDQKLDSVKTNYTDLVFKEGVLYIVPNGSKTYDFGLDASWLKIDFTQPKEILTLYLLFDGMVNKDLKNLLAHYKIKLPFLQKSGYMDTNLILDVNLISLDVDAKGHFYTNKAKFNYLGLDLDLKDTLVYLHNFNVRIPKMNATYKKIAQAKVKAQLNLKKGDGYIDFDVNKLTLNDNFKLNTQDKNFHVKYLISPNQDKIDFAGSKWRLDNKELILDPLSVPFNLQTLKAQIPATQLKIDTLLTAYVSGLVDLNNLNMDLDLDLLHFKYNTLSLAQSNAHLKAFFNDNKLTIASKVPLNFHANNFTIKLKELQLDYFKGKLLADIKNLEVQDLLKTNINVEYSLTKDDGNFHLNQLSFNNEALGNIFNKTTNIDFYIKSTNKQYIINASSLNISGFLTDEQWVLAFNSLDKLKPYSPFLRKYQIDKGTFSVYKRKDEKNIKFLANLDYKYKLILIDNKPISKYQIKGQINNNKDTMISVNDKIDISISNGVVGVIGESVGLDIHNILDLSNKLHSSNEQASEFYVSVSLSDSYIYLSDKRRILADTMDLQYLNKIISAQINHGQGEAGFKYKNKKFHLYGSKFNNIFMENLFAMSKFRGGSLDFSIKGDVEKFDGVMFVKDTTIREFRLLNNVLAFVNTIPSLITFSLPSYDSKGLHAKTAYMKFTYENNIYNISDISLESNELDILGHGSTSIDNDTIAMELNLKTDLASEASKIPVVGYILFDKDSISTTVKIDGKLSDPNIDSMLAKEIIVAPLNIIKRTLLLPFSIFIDD